MSRHSTILGDERLKLAPAHRNEGRVMLGLAIQDGIEPPAELVQDILLEGKSHVIYSGPGLGKTFLMLWLILQVIERGLAVLLYDTENGARIVAERLEQLGANPEQIDELLHYYPFPSLPTTEAGRLAFEAKLERVKPVLVCFDSWINLLASNGLDENASNDIATFASHYLRPARSRGIATLILDHVPHQAKHARGSTRKKDEADCMWSLHSSKPFDRDKIGEVILRRKKDREGWLPSLVAFSIGGNGAGGFVCTKSSRLSEIEEDDGLTPSERTSLEALQSFTATGAKASEWNKEAKKLNVGERSFWNALQSLKRKGHVWQDNKRYFVVAATNCNPTAHTVNAADSNAAATPAPPLKGAGVCSTGDNCACDGCLHGE